MAQKANYLADIRKWNTEELASVLYMNGLNDCVDAIKALQIDGEAFLNLTEGQLAFWRKYMNNVQIRRFWSVIQLAHERPKEFVGDFQSAFSNEKKTASIDVERIHSPIARSLENILGQKPGVLPNKNITKDDIIYENMETILREQRKLSYKNLPPKPSVQQQSNIKNNVEIRTEKESKIFPNKFVPKPVQKVQPIQNTNMINLKSEELNPTNDVKHVQSLPISNDSTKKYRSVPSPNTNTRPLPMPPKENIFPIPPNTVPLIPNWKIGLSDEEEFPIYYDVDHYKSKPWYSEIDRKKANDLLKGKPNGTFLARPSKRDNNECSLSIVYNNRIYNVAVIKKNDGVFIGNHEFNSVNEIIDFFMENEMVLNGHNNEDIVVTLRQI